MRTPFALTVMLLVFLGTAELPAQVIPPPVIPKKPKQVTNIYLITFRQNTPASERANALQSSGARLRRMYNALNAVSAEVPNEAALARLRNHPLVLSVFENRSMTLYAGQGHGVGAAANSNAGGGAKPKAPTSLSASPISSSQINLSWADNSDNENGFAIERCAGSGCANFSEIVRVNANIRTFSDTGLTPQTIYRYRVLAFGAAGNSKYSNVAEATTPSAPPPTPTAPNNLTSSVMSYSQINLSWSDNSSNEDGFRLERCVGTLANCTNPNFVEIAQTGPNLTSFNDLGLQAQTTYTYRVRAFNSAGSSSYSNSVEATTLAAPPPPPTAPNNLTSSVMSYSQINLSWSDNSNNEDGFRLERCTGTLATCADINFAQIAQVGTNVTSFSDLGLQAQTTYIYRARAFNSGGSSTYSNYVQAATPAAPPPLPTAPSGLALSVVSSNQINLSWTDNSNNEDGFRIQRCTGTMANCADANFAQIAQVGPNVTAYNNLGLQSQTTYTYRVLAFNSSGASAFSAAQATTPVAPPSTQVVPAGVQRIGAAPGTLNWTGAGVGVAIVDTGLDFNHPDLGLAPEIPGVNAFSAFSDTCQDIHGHGTHVAGIVGARNNTIDVVGVAPNATIYCVNVFQPDPVEEVSATDESLIAGLDWIATNANVLSPRIRVINMSLGREKTVDDDNPNHPLHLAVKALYDMGITVVVAAGNDPLTEVTQQIPAGYAEVIAVASTTAKAGVNGLDADFPACTGVPIIKADAASYFTTDGAFLGGTGVTISAPGETEEDIYSFADACFLEPVGILSLLAGGGTIELAGTSMASPHVAGVVALMWDKELSLGLTLAPESARTRIRINADRRGTAPLDSPLDEYTFDGEREGVIWAPSALGDAPPPPADTPPVVSILSPSNNSSFSAGANIVFQGTATDSEDGNIASALVWTSNRDGQIGTGASFTRTLSNGSHIITASLTDSGGNSGSASTSISVGASSTPTQVQASSITYAMQGTTLNYTVKVVNEFGGPVAGAAVNVDIMEWLFTGWIWISTATSDSQGNAHFQLQNADLGCYITSVRSVTATGLTWVGGTPSNNFCNF